MKVKNIISIILLTVLSLTAVAQEKHKIIINEPKGGSEFTQRLLTNALTKAAAESDNYQPFKRSIEQDTLIGKCLTPEYMLVTEINESYNIQMVVVRIIDFKSFNIVKSLMREYDLSLKLDELREKYMELANELFSKD